ncbi:MAG: GlmU family protein [Microscillaceae bacterium]|jgi:UDP-N-acetylglucosamine diphosphorylase/glucosamine-1-phosphate N-acetyltransferase|nr:GlmU family protein [Microscillaceae bacterium]
MNYILFDNPQDWKNLLPLTFTRPISGLRVGILTLAEKWEKYLGNSVYPLTEPYLQTKFIPQFAQENLFINSALLPTWDLVAAFKNLSLEQALLFDGKLLALKTTQSNVYIPENQLVTDLAIEFIQLPTDIFRLNGSQIQADFALLTKGRDSYPIPDRHTIVYNPENIFIEDGVKMKACILNAENGVIYLGKNAQVSEGAIIQGNFALGEGAVVNLGGKMRPNTTIGPYCKVGGEVSNSVLFAHSNKSHEGFLGNSVLGEWCNLGADTNNSNLKNNYSSVKIWNYQQADYVDTGLQFCGLIMGDHSKAGINTMFNTGTVIGVSANIFGGGFPPKFIPSFAWGGSEGLTVYNFEKSLETAIKVLSRRQIELGVIDRDILHTIFNFEK